MKTKTESLGKKIQVGLVAVLLALSGGSLMAAQQDDQIAIQLGAKQLGYPTPFVITSQNSQQAANALKQGQIALAATVANYASTKCVVDKSVTPNVVAVLPNPQADEYRAQYYQAILDALGFPALGSFNAIPVFINTVGTPVKVTGSLNPSLTTPTLLLQSAIADMPNFAPGLVGSAVSATMAGSITNGVFIPVWGAAPKPSAAILADPNKLNSFNQKTAAAQLANAGKAASAALTAACKAYAKGTLNWQGWPSNGVTNSNGYLPNFGLTTNGPKGGTGGQIQIPDLKGLADAASAVAANAINGLGNVNTNDPASGLYGKSQANVQSLAQQLVAAAKSFQATSINTKGGLIYGTGSLGAASFGLITQVAGYQSEVTNGVTNITTGGNQSWGAQGSPDTFTYLLNGVVRGAVKAVGTGDLNSLKAIATGVAQGFTATYLQTQYNADKTSIMSLASFQTLNTQQITAAFSAAGVTSTVISQLNTLGSISSGIANTYGCFNTNSGVWSFGGQNSNGLTIAGAPGINLGNTNSGVIPLFNGVGSPVTDTVGL